MEMLLRDIGLQDLAQIYGRHSGCSPAPYLHDSAVIKRAGELARKNGVWEMIDTTFDPTTPIPVLRRSAYRNFRRVGDRTVPQADSGRRKMALNRASLALWLGHPKADVDYLQDLLWAFCDDWTWVMAAHEGLGVDLGSAAFGATLAEILYLFDDKLEDEVKLRVRDEIDRRIFQSYWNYHRIDWWKTCGMNWNHVCNGEIIRAALYLHDDPALLAHLTHTPIQHMQYAIDGFTDDGGCLEGPSYWVYGFGHYLWAAYGLHERTGGELNIANDEKIERICRYPLAAHIAGKYYATFADAHHTPVPPWLAIMANSFHEIPELYGLCPRNDDGTLTVKSMHDLALYDGATRHGDPAQHDVILPDLGQVKIHGNAGVDQLILLAKAGDNGVNHNHNDIGSFIVHRRGVLHLTDPGGPTYTAKTFSERRYEILFCNSYGHSVPVINGNLQEVGSEYYGTLKAENLNGAGMKSALIDMTPAYPQGTVKHLTRCFTLDPAANELRLEDRFAFDTPPRSLEEAFITYEDAAVAEEGHVTIGPQDNQLILTACETAGTFEVQCLEEESKDGRTDRVVRRIRFVPDKLHNEMTLTFRIKAELAACRT